MGICNEICHWCLCRTCNKRNCPKGRLYRCGNCFYRSACHECDFYQNKYYIGVRRIRKRITNPKRHVTYQEYQDMMKLLEKLVKKIGE